MYARETNVASNSNRSDLSSAIQIMDRGQKRKLSTPPAGLLPSPYQPSAEKQRKFSNPFPQSDNSTWPMTGSLGGGPREYTFAGQEAERLYPDSKTTLNNALQQQLRQAEMKINYDVSRVYVAEAKRQVCRCSLHIPISEPFTVIGEGDSKKDAERRAGAAACVKLCVRTVYCTHSQTQSCTN